METVRLESIDDFLSMVVEDEKDTIYRGVSNASYELKPSIGRNVNWSANQITDTEGQYFEEFQQRAPLYLKEAPQTQLEWICLAQHFGLKTRLLDWTLNPLVALYFAVEKPYDRDFAVFSFSGGETLFTSIHRSEDPFTFQNNYRLFPSLRDQRYANQASVFTIHCAPWEEFDHHSVRKFVIPSIERDRVRRLLRRFQVNRSFIYPTLDQLSADIMEETSYRMRAFPESDRRTAELDAYYQENYAKCGAGNLTGER